MTLKPKPKSRFIPANREMGRGRRRTVKTEDFPVHTNQKQIVKNDGKTIAEASTKKIEKDVAEHLNAEEDRRE